ncbi:NADP-dependent 3-hydroxy acid dehydrogenase [Schizosaccharomyces pombe]|uniref:NADP-dependent 3-hydroxy acid dehydrogenase n=1 Tax=Schizosaccharomyces pombe (strain 972 / ATCC 24843) TaxID=284812 RepID=YI13_SCHPO|nr:putative dehydrogenase [Schizosaccharomyces pombe]Q9P7B4.1 RecName: Full=NADP-dependent 3-hydroxy acid dehydrogenase; AltName: Full=L-allo-threonine dehydrogenase [Schizosaccharomyces pombe 972h-]CAB86467.1 short chain dehydrogenase (predicted) [Schizosaccharomyces pombe]|eukprot:NP_593098.1 putative dehydrogenase [Schizosaccharomyces pombe]
MSRLDGKTILITGASSGIGKSTAFEIAKVAKVKLILAARRFSTVEEIAKELESKYEVSVLPLKLDVSDLKSIPGVIESLPKEFADIDVLINNAGLALGTDKVIDLNIDDAVTMITTNVLGMMAMTRAVLPIFYSKNKGDILNVGSIAGRESYVGGSVYCSTKSALAQFTSALRKETIDTRIRIMEVDPGLVETEFSVVRFHGDKQKADNVYKNSEPLTPEDIAEVILFALTRRENVVIADTLVFPSHQGGANHVYRKQA